MGSNKQKERKRKRSAASCQRPDQLFNSKRSKEDGDVEIIENDSEEPDTTEGLDCDMSHCFAQSDGRKSTGMYSYLVTYSYLLSSELIAMPV